MAVSVVGESPRTASRPSINHRPSIKRPGMVGDRIICCHKSNHRLTCFDEQIRAHEEWGTAVQGWRGADVTVLFKIPPGVI